MNLIMRYGDPTVAGGATMRINQKNFHKILCVLMILFLPVISSCVDNGEAKIRTWIDFPQQGNEFLVGSIVPITAHYYAGEGVGKVEININGQSIKEVSSPDITDPLGDLKYDWIPEGPGEYTIGVSIAASDGTYLSGAQVSVIVLSEEASAEGVFDVNGFCRTGPGTIYNRVSVFEAGYQVTLEARSEPGIPLWLYVYDPAKDIYCWVSFSIIETEVDPEQMVVRVSPPVPDPEESVSSSEITKCHIDLNHEMCIKMGGSWFQPLSAPGNSYCQCP